MKIDKLINEINSLKPPPIKIMEVCGSHTMAVSQHGIRSALPPQIEIISGPGCPICVTDIQDLDKIIQLAENSRNIIASFGDLFKIRIGNKSLKDYKNTKIIYSPLEAVTLAENEPSKEIILIGIGFETTIPLIASAIYKAKEKNIKNFSVLPIHKLVPPALEYILSKNHYIDGLILPGHVSVISGSSYFDFLQKFQISGIITGFSPQEILECLIQLVKSKIENKFIHLNHYKKFVSFEGNLTAKNLTQMVYNLDDARWRQIGIIPQSGLKLKEKYSDFDATKKFSFIQKRLSDPKGCLCGQIMMGEKSPKDCSLFKTKCHPHNPIGPCMVSSEGTCSAYFKYEGSFL